jgi:hypothetical protein
VHVFFGRKEFEMSEVRVNGLLDGLLKDKFGVGEDQPATTVDLRTLFGLVMQLLADGKLTKDDLPAVITYVETFYNQVIRPIDIPRLGPVAEKLFDDALFAGIRPGLTLLFDRFLSA